MAERRKNRKRKEPETIINDDKPSKAEYAVAKYLREKLPEKKTSLLGHKVDYFIASKAIDSLLDSPWATKSEKHDLLFTTRDSVVLFMDRMLQHKFFHRARKIIVQKEPKKKKENEDPAPQPVKDKAKEKVKGKEKLKEKEAEKDKAKSGETEKQKHKDKEEEEKSSKKTKSKDEEKAKDDEKGDSKKEVDSEKKKEKKKLKLDMHMEQLFLDGSEVYVWIYDPIPVRTWIIGMLMVVGAVLVCLFPLWPQVIRHYIYYISVAAALFLVFIIGLAIIRLIVFIIIWAVTFGKHHLWLLPNLTADVGFFESFWPLYEYEYKGAKKENNKEKESKDKKSKTKSSQDKDDEQNGSNAEKSDSSSAEKSDQEKKGDQADDHSESEEHDSEDEEEEKTKVDNGDNGFEILEKKEAEEEEKGKTVKSKK